MDDHSEGIQVEKPVPPWERPGCFRMDGEPHRAAMLAVMAVVGLVLSVFSLCLPPLLVLGIPLNLTTWYCARRDLAKMRMGWMDPEGEEVTVEARYTGWFGFALCIFWSAAWATFVLVFG